METKLEVKSKPMQLDTFGNYEDMRKAYAMAEKIAVSNIIPKDYQNNPSNCMIALDLAMRMNMSPTMVMQGLYVVHGRPSWSGQFAIAIINGARRYKGPLKFEMQGKGSTLSCYAYAEDIEGNVIKGSTVTWEMVVKEGWNQDKGAMKSKWNSMPEQMMMYRAASFFARVHCPDLLNGVSVEGEVEDVEKPVKEKPVNPFAKEAEAIEQLGAMYEGVENE